MAEDAVSDEGLPLGAEIDADGLWSQVLNRAQGAGLRAGLFLDRDGVVVEEVHYLHQPADVRLIGAHWLFPERRLSTPAVITY